MPANGRTAAGAWMLSCSRTARSSGQAQLSMQAKAEVGHVASLMSRAGARLASSHPANETRRLTAGVPLASVTHQGQAITYIAVPTGPSQINPQMQHALMKHAMASGLPGLQEQHGHVMKFEGGLEREGQAAAHAAGHAAGQHWGCQLERRLRSCWGCLGQGVACALLYQEHRQGCNQLHYTMCSGFAGAFCHSARL